MSDKKLGLEPAFSHACANEQSHSIEFGISKRFYAACTAMQGMLANSNPEMVSFKPDNIVRYAYIMADKLLKYENE